MTRWSCCCSRRSGALLVAGLSVFVLLVTIPLTVLAIVWTRQQTAAAAAGQSPANSTAVEFEIRLLEDGADGGPAGAGPAPGVAAADNATAVVAPEPAASGAVASRRPAPAAGGDDAASGGGAELNGTAEETPRGDAAPSGDSEPEQGSGAAPDAAAAAGDSVTPADGRTRPRGAEQNLTADANADAGARAGDGAGDGDGDGGRAPPLAQHLWLRAEPGPLAVALALQAVYLVLSAVLVRGLRRARAELVLVWLVSAGLGLAVGSAGAILSARTALDSGTVYGTLYGCAYVAVAGVLWLGWATVLGYYREATAKPPSQKPHFGDC